MPSRDKEKTKILLVEDERNVGSTLFERLEKEGFSVSWAKNAEEAQIEIEKKTFDLAILDVGLPDDSGFNVAKQIRILKHSTAIIFLTAFGSPEDRIHGLELGAEDYIVKPFHLKELLLRVNNVLRRAQTISETNSIPDPIHIGKAKISLMRFEAEVEGKTVPLTHRECAVLKILITHRGRVVSRDDILNEGWAEDEYPSPRTIDNFILRLRRLIEINPENPEIIRSIRGVGYQLADSLTGSTQEDSTK